MGTKTIQVQKMYSYTYEIKQVNFATSEITTATDQTDLDLADAIVAHKELVEANEDPDITYVLAVEYTDS